MNSTYENLFISGASIRSILHRVHRKCCAWEQEKGACLKPKETQTNTQKALDLSFVVANVLKYLPFHDRQRLRLVSQAWNDSRHFHQFWQEVDLRFVDLKRRPLPVYKLDRFISTLKTLDICVEQIKDLISLIHDCTRVPTSGEVACDISALLGTLPKLQHVHISQYYSGDHSIRSRVNPVLWNLPQVFHNGNDELKTLLVDCGFWCGHLPKLAPFMKSVECLVLCRVENSTHCSWDSENAVSSSLIAELLEHIPPNQLKAIQIGTTIPRSNASQKLCIPPVSSVKRHERLEYASKQMNVSISDLEPGDEIISVLLKNHSQSLEYLIVSCKY
ncbi:bifunctional F-box domain/F-box-like domain superfamily [Babesia duncani]|uniref:Bifunctional F-box domain/F-box-like domain superfamily n=1 Tax=Babesia duncani TaxID=323732 RepID=A0AAD9PM80_9APIC|nr:bifunctional F-box domain/F-box-like domain superfamily [Babesia duncani]